MRLNAIRLLLGVGLGVFVQGSSAALADTTVNFDDRAAGTQLTDQYADAGGPGQGVIFGTLPGAAGTEPAPPVIQAAAGQAHSGSQVANLHNPTYNEGIGTYTPQATATFQVPRHHVLVYVGFLGAPAPLCAIGDTSATCAEVTLQAFDASGNQIASSTPVTVARGASVGSQLEVSTTSDVIKGFRIIARAGTDDGKDVAIDDLSFNTPSAPPPPFSVRIQGSTNLSLGGCTVTVPVVVSRQASFPGPVSLSVTGLPASVSASFQTNPATFPGGALSQSIPLTLTVPNSGHMVLARTATIHATASSQPEQTTTFRVGGTCPQLYDPEVVSMQVTQGTQLPELPKRDPAKPAAPIPYASIANLAKPGSMEELAKLVFDRPTMVRVYADLRYGPSTGVRVPAVLRGFRRDSSGRLRELPDSPILPVSSPSALVPGLAQSGWHFQDSYDGTYTFNLPFSWARGRVELEAALLPTEGGSQLPVNAIAAEPAAVPGVPVYAPCTSDACITDRHFAISDIPFMYALPVEIRPVRMITTHPYDHRLTDPLPVFNWAQTVTPVPLIIDPYAGTIDITNDIPADPNSTAVTVPLLTKMSQWTCDNGGSAGPFNVGVEDIGLRSAETNLAYCWEGFPIPQKHHFSTAYVNSLEPLVSVAHELFHLFGRPHAGQSSTCAAVPPAEAWPPDDTGRLQSVGLAPAPSNFPVGLLGPYQDIPGDGTTGLPPWFDLMSYCGSVEDGSPLRLGQNRWVSTHNWNAVLGPRGFGPARDRSVSRVAGRAVPSLHVTASVPAGGPVRITSVSPVNAPPQPATNSGYHLIARDSAGHTLSDVQMLVGQGHADARPPKPFLNLDAVVPAAGVSSVAIVNSGVTLATRSRSAHAPSVKILGTPAFRAGNAVLRWSAADRDHDPLTAEIDYSGDNGRHFKTIWLGPDRGSALLPAAYLFRSSHARVRVFVSDGFLQTGAISRAFRSPGAPPLVHILEPQQRLRQPNDAPLVLSGQAFDDRSRRLSGPALRWMLGRRLLGTGERITVSALAAGTRRIDLFARDSFGRTSRASVVVRLSAARPVFLALSAPRSVSRNARAMRITVASSLPAGLMVQVPGLRAQRFVVSRAKRSLLVRLPRGRRALNLRLSLSSGGLSRRALITIKRR